MPDHVVVLQSIHDWQSLVEIARALGATPAHISNSIDRGHLCHGRTLEMRTVGPEEAVMFGYDGRTQRLFRVPRWSSELARLRALRDEIWSRAQEVEQSIQHLEA